MVSSLYGVLVQRENYSNQKFTPYHNNVGFTALRFWILCLNEHKQNIQVNRKKKIIAMLALCLGSMSQHVGFIKGCPTVSLFYFTGNCQPASFSSYFFKPAIITWIRVTD